MKKFNIFSSSANKKEYNNSQLSPPSPPGVGGTIVRIVAKKEVVGI